ncbi:MAG TPA: DUF2339 domain-containing protein, partial [Gemmatimonadales bacterium]|nr:DUF2339 domain-containing protein [Gemmatimonadales bacterium]
PSAQAAPSAPSPAPAPIPLPKAPPVSAPPAAAAEPPSEPLPGARVRPSEPGLEEWIGGRGLLAVGVVALLLATGYLLKLSFERGWISPPLRCVGGVAAGIVVGAIGWRLQERYRTYGAALIGCGAGIIYIAVWSAARLYGLMPPATAIAALALVSISLAVCAFAIDVEALGATAALGAFLAPVVLGRHAAQANLLLIYLAALTAGLGWVAGVRRWRLAALVVAASTFGLGLGIAGTATQFGVVALAAGAGGAGLLLGLEAGWWELPLISFFGGWLLLATAASGGRGSPIIVLGALVLAAPIWARVLRRPDEGLAGIRAETVYLMLTPVLIAMAIWTLSPATFRSHPGLDSLIVAVPFLAVGYLRARPTFSAIGVAALVIAAWLHWSGLGAVIALLAIAVAVALADHLLDRFDGRTIAVAALGAALYHLVTRDLIHRPIAEAAFVGSWALALWATTAVTAALATPLRRRVDSEDDRRLRVGLFTLAAGLLFVGVTAEIGRLSGQVPVDGYTANFARGIATVIWWLLAGAVLVHTGRRLGAPVRTAGLLALLASLLYLGAIDFTTRTATDPAFWGLWAITLWLAAAVVVGLAASVGRAGEPNSTDGRVSLMLWAATGLTLFLGVTGELGRFFRLHGAAGDSRALAGSLAISAWWLLFAAGLVILGFRRGRKQIRIAGLAVAGLALTKVIVSDLSSLDALYRVASVLILGLVSLSLAYLYHRQDRRRTEG